MESSLSIKNDGNLQNPLPLALLGAAADAVAARAVFPDYLRRISSNTKRRQAADLASFARYLEILAARADQAVEVGLLMEDPEAWSPIRAGLVAGWREWLLAQGYAVSTVNVRLSTVRRYARLAARAGTLDPGIVAQIREVAAFPRRQFERVDAEREKRGQEVRIGPKKAEPVWLSEEQAGSLKDQPDTPQGRRDRVLICLLLDHGLRCGEIALLQVEHVDLRHGSLRFRRPKVQREQTHKLTRDTAAALRRYLATDQRANAGPLILGSRRGGKLSGAMGERAITARVELLGELIGVTGLSAHDGRHYWATQAAAHQTPLERLQDADGWSSLAMPARYIQAAAVANEGVKLGE